MIKKILLLVFILALYNGCQKDLSTSPEDIFLTKNGLVVESYPAGAKIYIDGKNTGQYTPDTIYWLHEGNLKITLKLDYFKDTSLTIYKNSSDTQKVFFDYKNNPNMFGIVSFDSAPREAEIFINDSSLNQRTPYETRKAFPGVHKVTYKKPGYWDESKMVTIRSSFTSYVNQNLIDTLTWINYDISRTDIPSDYLTALDIGKDYVKWIGTIDAGLVKFNDKSWTTYNTSNSILPDNKINYIKVDENNIAWVCTNYGLVKIDGDNWNVYNSSNSPIPNDNVTAVSTKNNRVWIGTMGGGVAIFDGIKWDILNKDNSRLPSNQVNYIYHNDVDIWICTGGGLLKISEFLNDTTYNVLTAENDGMPTNNVTTMAVDNNGYPWIGFGTSGKNPGGTSYKSGKFWTTYTNQPSAYVYSIAVDKNNHLWFGSSENGLSKLSYGSWINYTTNNSLIGSDRIFKVVIDNLGHKWMASFGGGLIKYKGN